MAERWSDERLDAALAALAEELEVAGPAGSTPRRTPPARQPRLRLVAAALVVGVVVATVATITPARETVARWFGVRVERDDDASAGGSFADGVSALDVDDAIALTGLDDATFDATPLGRPTAAGTPPEGGVVLAWPDGAATLWVRPGDDDVVVVKRLVSTSHSDPVPGIGDYAFLIDGDHVLDTPSRRVAAGRVLWWLADGQQWRLESDLDPTAMRAIARALSPP